MDKETDKERYTRAYVAFQKQGYSDLLAINKAHEYLSFYKKQKNPKGLFPKADTTQATVRG